MINSLRKDSHITQSFWHPQVLSGAGRGVNKREEYSNVPAKNSISVNKPAEINFSGLSSAKLVHEDKFKKLVQEARNFLGEKSHIKDVKKLIDNSVNFLTDSKASADETLKTFLSKTKNDVLSVIEETKKLLHEEHARKPLSNEELGQDIKKTISTSVEIYPTVENPGKIYTSEWVKKFFLTAEKNQPVFSAAFALLLTCLLRPAAIVALPSEKKNNDDKKYAAAHSIASGIIGYLISSIIFSPIGNAMKKIDKCQRVFLSKNSELEYLQNGKIMANAKTWMTMLPELILSPPKAILTIALIPPILKYIFGWKKKSSNEKAVSSKVEDNSAKTDIQTKNKIQNINGGVK